MQHTLLLVALPGAAKKKSSAHPKWSSRSSGGRWHHAPSCPAPLQVALVRPFPLLSAPPHPTPPTFGSRPSSLHLATRSRTFRRKGGCVPSGVSTACAIMRRCTSGSRTPCARTPPYCTHTTGSPRHAGARAGEERGGGERKSEQAYVSSVAISSPVCGHLLSGERSRRRPLTTTRVPSGSSSMRSVSPAWKRKRSPGRDSKISGACTGSSSTPGAVMQRARERRQRGRGGGRRRGRGLGRSCVHERASTDGEVAAAMAGDCARIDQKPGQNFLLNLARRAPVA